MTDTNSTSTGQELEPLTEREREILACLAEGLSNQEIANQLYLSVKTVRWYNSQIYSKLGVHDREAALKVAEQLGLLAGADGGSRPEVRNNLPAQTTAFVGRQAELDDLADLLAQPDVRLVTILAPGGMGKTRLGLAAAEQQLSHFTDGVFFVPLAPLSSVDDIVPMIAESVGFSFSGSEPPKQQLLDFFRSRMMLLLLDNYEHLLEGAPLVTDLLQAAPDVKVLVTSREKLNLSGETVFILSGLHFPDWETPTDALEYDAVRLFIQSARRVRPDGELQADDLMYLARICRLTAGMPLALVLAAGWLDVLTLEQIAGEIQQGIDILETELRDLPERQRSIRATFTYSWVRLSEAEQTVFMKLSVFRGGFTAEAAERVAGATIRQLRKLVDKAFVQTLSGGRYDIHELLRQYGEEQLEHSAESRVTHDAHSAYFVEFLRSRWQPLRNDQQKTALDDIEREFENIRTMWHDLLEQERFLDLRAVASSLWYFSDLRNRQFEGLALFTRAIEVLRSIPKEPDIEIVLGHLLGRQAFLFTSPSRLAEGKAAALEALALLGDYNRPEEIMLALDGLAINLGFLGELEGVLQACEQGLQIANSGDYRWYAMRFLYWASNSAAYQGNYEAANRMAQECLAIAEQVGDHYMLGATHAFTFGEKAAREGNYPEAKRWATQALSHFEHIHMLWGMGAVCGRLGRVAFLADQYEEAAHYYMRAIRLLDQSHLVQSLLDALVGWAELRTAQGYQDEAVALLSLVLCHSNLAQTISRAEQLRVDLEHQMDRETYGAAWERGKSLELGAVVRNLLATHCDSLPPEDKPDVKPGFN